MNELNFKDGYILTYNEEKILNESGFKIKVIPIWKWLLSNK